MRFLYDLVTVIRELVFGYVTDASALGRRNISDDLAARKPASYLVQGMSVIRDTSPDHE